MSLGVNDLSNIQLDVLRELGNIGAGNAVTALAKMLNKRIDMTVPKVKILNFNEVASIVGGEETIVAGILLRVTGDLTANMMFMLDMEAAHIFVNILMGKPVENRDDFAEIEISALREIGNILAGSYLNALSMLTNLGMAPSVPELAIDMAGAIISVPAIEFGKVGDSVLYIETEFVEGSTSVMGDVFLVPDVESYDTLLRALGVVS